MSSDVNFTRRTYCAAVELTQTIQCPEKAARAQQFSENRIPFQEKSSKRKNDVTKLFANDVTKLFAV